MCENTPQHQEVPVSVPLVLGTSIQEQRLLASGQRTSLRVVLHTWLLDVSAVFFTVAWSCSRRSRVGFSQMKLHSSVASLCLPCVTKLTDGCRASLVLPCLRGGYVQTWLILPVVICLSQRLSHACLSISFYTAKLRMAH